MCDKKDSGIKALARELMLNGFNSVSMAENISLNIVDVGLGEIGFEFELSSTQAGKVFVRYEPQVFFEDLLTQCLLQIGKKENADIPGEALLHVSLDTIIGLSQILSSLMPSFYSSLLALPVISGEFQEYLKSEEFLAQTALAREKKIEELILESNTGNKKTMVSIANQHLNSVTAPQFLFCEIYDQRKELWKDAQKLYKQTKHLKNVLELVSTAYPDLCPELINKLDDLTLDSYLKTPSKLALDETAWLLNAPDRAEKTLWDYLKKSRELRKAISDESAAEALEVYWESVREREELEMYFDDLRKKFSVALD